MIADIFFRDAPGYILGDMVLIERMAASWDALCGAAGLAEYERPMSARQYVEILVASRK